MSKKLLFVVEIFMALVFAFSHSFVLGADNNMMNDAKGAVNEAVNDVRDVVGGAENAMNDTVNSVTNGMNNRSMSNTTGYTANRTATTSSNESTFLGMGSTAWTWLILAIAAVAIVALVWYYSSQITNRRNYDDNE